MQVNTSLYITLHLLKLLRLDCATPKAFLIIAKKKIRYINVILPEVANLWQKSWPCFESKLLALIEYFDVYFLNKSGKLVRRAVWALYKFANEEVLLKKLGLSWYNRFLRLLIWFTFLVVDLRSLICSTFVGDRHGWLLWPTKCKDIWNPVKKWRLRWLLVTDHRHSLLVRLRSAHRWLVFFRAKHAVTLEYRRLVVSPELLHCFVYFRPKEYKLTLRLVFLQETVTLCQGSLIDYQIPLWADRLIDTFSLICPDHALGWLNRCALKASKRSLTFVDCPDKLWHF